MEHGYTSVRGFYQRFDELYKRVHVTLIDLHNHILWKMDDGASDLDESLEIARQFVSEGVHRIAATPHFNPLDGQTGRAPSVVERVSSLRYELSQAGILLDVMQGNELLLTPESPRLLREGQTLTLGNSRAVLIEVSLMSHQPPVYFEDSLFRLQLEGFTPVLAHPERYAFVQRRIEHLDSAVSRGLVLQLTAPALLGEYGYTVRRTAERLLQKGAYLLAASDRHHPGPNRSLEKLHQRIVALCDKQTADLLLKDNPSRLLDGDPLIPADVTRAEQPSFFSRLLNRA